MSEPSTRDGAGFASRALALVVDAVLVGLASFLLAWTATEVATLLVRPSYGERLGTWLATAGGLVLAAAYQVLSWTLFGRTLGKALLGLTVTTTEGRRPGFLRSLARVGGYALSTLGLGLGFLWVLFDGQRRAWHDMLAGTRVVYRSDARTAPTSRDASSLVRAEEAVGALDGEGA